MLFPPEGQKILRGPILIILVVDKQLKLVRGVKDAVNKGVGFENGTSTFLAVVKKRKRINADT
jgi:hypothetical protein